MKIRSKFFSVIAFNLLIIVVVTAVVSVNVHRIADAFKDVAGTTTPAIIHLYSMNESFHSAAYNTLAYALTREEDRQAALEAGIQGLDAHKDQLMTLVRGGSTVAPEEDRALLERINSAEAVFIQAARELSQHVDQDGVLFINHDELGLNEDLQRIAKVNNSIRAVAEPLDEWIAMEKDEIVEAQEGVETSVSQALLVAYLLGVLAALVTVVINGWVAFRISRPIVTLEATARAIAAGDLSQRANVQGKDELGQLATTFNAMTDKLASSQTGLEAEVRARTKELESIKGNLESNVEERTAELEKLKAGLEKTVEERTRDLKEKMSELERMNQMMTGRELKMVEMKKEISRLEEALSAASENRAPSRRTNATPSKDVPSEA